MNRKSTLFLSFIFTFLCSNWAYAACPTGNVTLSTQAEVDAYGATYPGCNSFPAGFELTIEGAGITNLDGLSVLEIVNGDLEIQNCPDLIDITGLSNLHTVNPDGELEIENCDALENLTGLEGLTSCHDLEIKSCASLTNIDALSNLGSLSGEFVVKNNPSLTECEGLCGVLNLPGPFAGNIEVFNNGGYPCDDFTDWDIYCELLALPVELSSFKGYAMERTNLLNWQTESEENTMVFLVERSFDGRRDFTEVGRVNAVGFSTTLQNYEIEDADPISLGYYRLRIVDFDGTFEFSEVVAVQRTKTEIDLVEVYPNPAEEQVTVLIHAQAAGKAIMVLSDFMGRKIKEEKMELNPGVNRYTLDWDKHETNFYYLTIDNGNERIAKKILRASRD